MILPSTPPSWAAETECNNTFGTAIKSGTLGNVVVPAGKDCFIWGNVSIKNLRVEERGALHVFGGVTISGNLVSAGADHVAIGENIVHRTNSVYGNVVIGDTIKATTIRKLVVGQNLNLEGNNGAVTLTDNPVGQNLIVKENKGGVTIDQNVILRNLICEDNADPFVVGTNSVASNKLGQCA